MTDSVESRPGAAAALNRARTLARALDARWTVPGTKLAIGADALIGLVPGVGDVLTAAPALYVVAEAARLGARRRVVMGMVGRTLADVALGFIPFVGDFLDLGFRSNLRNVEALERELGRLAAEERDS